MVTLAPTLRSRHPPIFVLVPQSELVKPASPAKIETIGDVTPNIVGHDVHVAETNP
jgi:hypothetical protein